MSMPLIYGQQIEWNDDEVDHRDNIIKNFKRSLATLEARMINREGQVFKIFSRSAIVLSRFS